MGLIGELRRRNVIRMAGLYLVGAWLVIQVAGTLLPVFEAPLPWFKPLQGDPRHKALIERIGAGPNAGAVR